MPRVVFTSHLQRFLDLPTATVEGATVRAVLEAAFAANPRLRGYVVDDAGRLRQHVNVFVDGTLVEDRVTLADPVADDSEVFVLQALSGGAVAGSVRGKG
jgi:sulfur-carrier protein